MSVASPDSGNLQIKPLAAGGFLLSGELTFETIPSVWRTSSALLSEPGDITFDLQGISHTDSAGLALLIDWMRTARGLNKRIAFKNIPAQMLAIATVSGLEDILPVVV